MKIKNIHILWFLLFLSIISNFILFSEYNYEILATKQYFSNNFYHGGYVAKIIDLGGDKDFFLLHSEAEMNFFNVYNFISKDKKVQLNFSVYGGTSTDRLYIPFLVSAITIASFGNLDVVQSYFILNITMWLLSIFLIYHITVLMLKDKTAALIASILLSSYPVFTLLFQSLKGQNGGVIFMLIGIFLHEKYLFNCDFGKRINIGADIGLEIETAPSKKSERKFNLKLSLFPEYIEKFVMFTLIFFIGFYFSGGNLYFLLFLIGRYITGLRKDIWKPLIILAVSFIAAKYLTAKLNDRYCLHFVSELFNLSKIIKDTLIYIAHLPSGAGTGMEQYSFLNYPGFKFFKVMFLILKNITLTNPLLWILALAAVIIKRANWKYLFIAIVLIGAHLGTFVTGWFFHYGYMSAGTLTILIIMSAFTIGACVKGPSMFLKIIGYLLLLAALGVFMLDAIPGVRLQLNNFYGGNCGIYMNKKCLIYHYENHNEY